MIEHEIAQQLLDPFGYEPDDPDIDAEMLGSCLAIVGRASAPQVLSNAWNCNRISFDTLAAWVGRIWSITEFPDSALDRSDWLDMFQSVGFTVDGKRAERPTEPITLYRGSVPERRTDWSWTTDRAVAEKYAKGDMPGRPKSIVWQITAPPEALLAANLAEDGRQESEYIVNTEGLEIIPAPAEEN